MADDMKFVDKHLAEGTSCPFCGSEDIEGDSVEIVGTMAVQECSCINCEGGWHDEYVLTHVIALGKQET